MMKIDDDRPMSDKKKLKLIKNALRAKSASLRARVWEIGERERNFQKGALLLKISALVNLDPAPDSVGLHIYVLYFSSLLLKVNICTRWQYIVYVFYVSCLIL